MRALLASGEFLYMPSAATPIEGRLAEAAGVKLVYTGGYAPGASRAISEPLLTIDEQVRVAGEVARAVSDAEQMGVSPSAPATCVVESGCQNVGGSGRRCLSDERADLLGDDQPGTG